MQSPATQGDQVKECMLTMIVAVGGVLDRADTHSFHRMYCFPVVLLYLACRDSQASNSAKRCRNASAGRVAS